MSDYTPVNNFSVKDDLPSGSAAKKIMGADWDDEFAAIVMAITSKYDDTDIANQATAEAGSSNTTLITPLRLSQYLTASRVGRLAAALKDFSIVRTTGAAASGTLSTGSLSAGTLYEYTAVFPITRDSGSSVTLDLTLNASGYSGSHYLASPQHGATGGLNNPVGIQGTSSLGYVTSSATDLLKVRGLVYGVTAGGIIRLNFNAGANATVGASAYLAYRRLAS